MKLIVDGEALELTNLRLGDEVLDDKVVGDIVCEDGVMTIPTSSGSLVLSGLTVTSMKFNFGGDSNETTVE